MMAPGLFLDASFDVICMFQVLDHIFDPAAIVETCSRLLRPGGFLLSLNHNIEATSAQWMKDRSPIIDIEHTYLYSPRTMSLLFSKAGLVTKETGTVRNHYSLTYLFRLAPLPKLIKQPILAAFQATRIGRISLSVPLGNLYTIAQKPQ
jgi:SAM-dependent methyltransferase